MSTTLACALLVALGGIAPAQAADPKPADDPKAAQLLGEVAKAYQGLKAYADQGEFVLAAKVDGKLQSTSMPLKISLERPNKFALDAGEVQVACDGTSLNTVVGPLKKYSSNPAPK